jgi:hypothetical protein
MSARAQREMLKRNTYREEHGLPTTTAPWQGDRDQGRQHQPMQSVDSGYGSSSKGEDYDESKMYSLDIQRSSGQRPVRPSRPGDYRSDSSHESIPGLESAYGAQHPQHQPYMYSGNAEHGQTQPLAKRISQRINKRLSVASFLGEPAPLTQADEKRLEEERMLKAEEERKLDEEEKEMLKRGLFNWSELKSWRFWIRKEWWSTCTLRSRSRYIKDKSRSYDRFLAVSSVEWYIILALCAVVAALFTIYHDQIVKWLTPYAQKLKE